MGARPDCPEFIAATLPPPLQWEGVTIWRADLKQYQFSNGQAWLTTTHQDPTTGALVGAGGVEIVRTDDVPGADNLRSPPEHFSSTAAISTTATIRITPTGVYRMARIAWVNNGGSGSGVLYAAANCGNDVEGLVASQSAKQRDATLTIGDAIQLVSPVPITSLNFSADTSYTAATHLLLVSFGE